MAAPDRRASPLTNGTPTVLATAMLALASLADAQTRLDRRRTIMKPKKADAKREARLRMQRESRRRNRR